MTTTEQKSKLLARWLRHRPDAIGLTLDNQGWTGVAELLTKAAAAGTSITHEELMQVVVENDKHRFSLSPDGLRIRAAQGHSIKVNLKLPFTKPSPVLYHGTVRKFMAAIRKQDLIPGARRGAAVVLIIETYPMLRDGFQFRCADNGVWLIPSVPAKYLGFPEESGAQK